MYACSAYLSPLFSSQNITVIVAGEKATEAEGEGGKEGYCPAAALPQFRGSARNVNIPLLSVVSNASVRLSAQKGTHFGHWMEG